MPRGKGEDARRGQATARPADSGKWFMSISSVSLACEGGGELSSEKRCSLMTISSLSGGGACSPGAGAPPSPPPRARASSACRSASWMQKAK